ncbi:efflux RND transporter permease subunit [Cecembia calidifontis]|nr:efflux RND transporter permease subunit [Cecembia calidifontis]
MMFIKKQSYFGLLIASIILLMMAIFPPKVFFDYDFESFFPQDDADLAFYQEFREEFENDNDYLLIALGHKDVFDAGFLEDFQSFKSQLGELEQIERVYSLLDVEDVVINPFGIQRKKLLDWSDEGSLEQSKRKILGSERWKGNLISANGDFLLLIAHNQQQISKEVGDVLYGQIVELLEGYDFEKVYTAGKIKAQGEFVRLMQEEFSFFLGISFVLIILILFLIFRSWWTVLTAMLVIAIALIWSLALGLYFGKALDVMSVMQPTILSIIALAALVHYFNHYLNYLRHDYSKDEAIQKSFSEITIAVFLTCMTTSLGFMSLYFTSVPTLKFFGLYTGLGVLIVFFAIVLITPGLLYLIPPLGKVQESDQAAFWRKSMRIGFLGIIKRQQLIIWFFTVTSLFSVWALTGLKVNGYILDNLPREHELIREFSFFDREFGGSKPLEFWIEKGPQAGSLIEWDVLRELDKLEEFIHSSFETGPIISPVAVVKSLNQALNSGNGKAFVMPSQGQWKRMEPYLERAYQELPTKILSDDQKSARISTRMEDIGSLRSVALKNHLDQFLEQEIDPDLLKVSITGTSHLIDISHESVSRQMMKGLVVAFLIVAIIAGFLFRSWRIAVIVLIPNIIPLLWMCGLMWLLGIELKLTTAILFTVAFGIAVDDSIHFMSKLRIELDKGRKWLYALKRTFIDTGKAIILTTLILSAGFAVLIFSQFGVTFYAGLLISTALVFALMADLLLLPVLLIRLGKIWEKKKPKTNH